MIKFQLGETVVITHTVQKKVAGVWQDYDPATSVKVSVYKEGTATPLVSDADMSKDSTSNYHYDFQTAGKTTGKYRARVTDTDGTRIVMKDGVFSVE